MFIRSCYEDNKIYSDTYLKEWSLIFSFFVNRTSDHLQNISKNNIKRHGSTIFLKFLMATFENRKCKAMESVNFLLISHLKPNSGDE